MQKIFSKGTLLVVASALMLVVAGVAGLSTSSHLSTSSASVAANSSDEDQLPTVDRSSWG